MPSASTNLAAQVRTATHQARSTARMHWSYPREVRSQLLDGPLPTNLDAERSVLGAILLDNHALAITQEKINPEDFFLDQHRRVFLQMIALGETQQAIDLVTLADELHRKGELEAAGGAAYLAQLMDGVPRVANVEHYARIVKEKALLRDLIHVTDAIQQQALEAEEHPNEILNRAAQMLSCLQATDRKKARMMAYTAPELVAVAHRQVEHIAYPIAARGVIGVLDGPPKTAGKSTLVLTGMSASLGERPFLNRATQRVPIVLVSEENPQTLRLALERAGLAHETDLHIMPFCSVAGRPWPEIVQGIEQLCRDIKAGWLALDTFFAIAGLGGEDENKAGAVDQAAAPLRAMAGRLNLAITLTRHERKSGGEVGVSGRGSSALTGAVDTVALLKRLPGNRCPERRALEITGRIEQARFEIQLQDRHYIIVEPANFVDETELVAQAITANPRASIRELAKATGIGRNRVAKLAAKAGWVCAKSGWERGGT